jgi:hypothetical protein
MVGQSVEQGRRQLLVAGEDRAHSANARLVVTTVARRS